jgi:probable phosphoglycerate mutase
MAHFVFIRHGESVLNVENRQVRVFCGQAETPLTERGREQARVVGKQLAARNDLVLTTAISSALERASQTLDLMLSELACTTGQPVWSNSAPIPARCGGAASVAAQPPHVARRLPDSPALNERSLGLFDGCRAPDVYAQHPEYRDDPALNQFDNHFTQKAPGGENLREVTERAWPVIEELDRSYAGDILIVSHHTAIRCVLGRALGLPDETVRRIRVPHTVPIIVERGGSYRLVEGLELPDG